MATILVVDDRDLNWSFPTTLLSYGGHRLLEACNGPEGLSKVRIENPEELFLAIQKFLLKSGSSNQEVRR